jgi:hypothetical protein
MPLPFQQITRLPEVYFVAHQEMTEMGPCDVAQAARVSMGGKHSVLFEVWRRLEVHEGEAHEVKPGQEANPYYFSGGWCCPAAFRRKGNTPLP